MTKGRWRVLLKCLDEDTNRILDTSIVCCVVHNICVLGGDELNIDDSDEDDDSDGDDDDSGPPPPPRLQLRFYKPLFNMLPVNK